MRKKQILANLFDKVLPDSLLPFANGLFSRKLTVLAYHRVVDYSQEEFFFDYELVSADSKGFEFQVEYVKKYFTPVTMEQVIDSLEGKSELPPKPLLITFDDGFDDNYNIAFPILKKHKVPATFFISTNYIDTKETIWFDKLVAYVINAESGMLEIEELDKIYELTDDRDERKEIAFDILGRIKRVSDKVRHEILQKLFKKSAPSLDKIDYSQSQMMTWEQVKEMKENGMSIGSHTLSHPILTMMNESELDKELGDSKALIEGKLKFLTESISYPNGGPDDFNELVLNKTEAAGYKIGFSYIGGKNYLPIKDKFSVKRLHVEHYIDNAYFKALACMPNLFSDQ